MAQTPVTKGKELLPRKVIQPRITRNTEQSLPVAANDPESTNVSGMFSFNVSSGPTSLASDLREDGIEDAQKSELLEGRELGQHVAGVPEVTHETKSFAKSPTADLGFEIPDHAIAYFAKTTTKVESVEQSAATSETISGQQKQSHMQGGVSRKPSLYHKMRLPQVDEAGKSSPTSHTISETFETRRFDSSSVSVHKVVQEKFGRIERTRREEMDNISSLMGLMTVEYDDYKRFCQVQLEACEAENKRLLRDNAALITRVSILESRLGGTLPAPISPHDNVEPTITKVTTTIITVITRIERWKGTIERNTGSITIPPKELEQLISDLSTTSSQMKELQQQYSELSKDHHSVHDKLQQVLIHCEKKDLSIASLTADINEWKNTDAERGQQLSAVRGDNEALRQDLSKLQHRVDAQSNELDFAHNELKTKSSLVEEGDRTVASLTAEVARWRESDAKKEERIAIITRDHEQLQKDFSATNSQVSELQTLYDVQFNEAGSVRDKIQAYRSQVEEKDRKITTLTAEVDELERSNLAKERQIEAEHKDKLKLQTDLATFSQQTAELQDRYDAQLKEGASVRSKLQAKISLLQEKEHAITSLSTEVAEAKREYGAKEEQVLALRGDVERLRGEQTSTSQRLADLQKRFDDKSRELDSVRDKLIGPSGSSDDEASGIDTALEHKNKEMEELRQDLANSNSRNTVLQASYQSLSRELGDVRDELQATTSEKERTIASHAREVEKLKRADATKEDQLVAALKRSEKLDEDLSTSTSQLTELKDCYKAQSSKFIDVRKELQESISSNGEKDRVIASLRAENDQWKRTDSEKAEEIAVALKRVKKLEGDLSASTIKFAALQSRYETQSNEISSVHEKLATLTSLHESDVRTVDSLTAELQQWQRSYSEKVDQMASVMRQITELQSNLTTSNSQLAGLRDRYEDKSRELDSLRNGLGDMTSSAEDKERTIAGLTVQVKGWMRKDVLMGEAFVKAGKQAEALQLDLAKLSAENAKLQKRCEEQLQELSSLRDQLRDVKDATIPSLLSDVQEWKLRDAATAGELSTARSDLEQVRRDLATSLTQIERWESEDTNRTQELTNTRKDLEQLRHNLSASYSQIAEHQKHSADLTSQIDLWKRSDAANKEELVAVREKYEQLQCDLSTSNSQIAKLQQLCEQLQATKPVTVDQGQVVATLKAQIEQWKLADSTKAEELEVLRCKISSMVSNKTEGDGSDGKDYTNIIEISTTVDEWLRADAQRAEELGLELAKRNEEIQRLRSNLVALKTFRFRIGTSELKEMVKSQTIEIQQRYEEKLRRLESALAERQSQLDGVQSFVATADTFSDTAIIQMLQKLNAEVQQSTTQIADDIIEKSSRATKQTKKQILVAQNVSHYIGEPLASCLGKGELDDMTLYLPIAFQAYLSHHLRWVISSWTIDKGYNDCIKKIYEQLQNSETQEISGRWRSVTRTYISPTCLSDPDIVISDVMQGLSDIVVAAGFPALSSVGSKLRERMSIIISAAGQLGKMIGKNVSADFEILAANPTEPFEDATMEEVVDDYDKRESETAAGQKVLCSTHLGMAKRMQSAERGKKDTLTVMKPKVILESFLDSY